MCVLSYAQRTVALRAPLCRGFFRQEPWRGLPFPIPGNLPNPQIETASHVAPALAGESFSRLHLKRGGYLETQFDLKTES